MSIDSVLQYTCDRCWLTVIPEFTGTPEGWLSAGVNDYCENCRDKVNPTIPDARRASALAFLTLPCMLYMSRELGAVR